jgi:hypothetical protein
MGDSRTDVARVREALESLVDLSGLSRREIERRLARQERALDVGRLLSGKFELKLHHMLDIIRVLDVHPVEFFRLVFKEPERRSPLIGRVQALFTSGKPAVGPRHPHSAGRDLDELHRRLDELALLIEELRARSK